MNTRDLTDETMECRSGCGACCIDISISSPLPGMPDGKPAGTRCENLDGQNRCLIHGSADYPRICASFRAHSEMCGSSYADAARYLRALEAATSPPAGRD